MWDNIFMWLVPTAIVVLIGLGFYFKGKSAPKSPEWRKPEE